MSATGNAAVTTEGASGPVASQAPAAPARGTLIAILGRRSVPRATVPGERPRALGTARLRVAERAQLASDMRKLAAEFAARPRTRGDCPPAGQPCPWAGCRHSLLVEVKRLGARGSVKVNFPDRDVDEIEETCSLRVADAVAGSGESLTREEVGVYLNLGEEQVRVIEYTALLKLRAAFPNSPALERLLAAKGVR